MLASDSMVTPVALAVEQPPLPDCLPDTLTEIEPWTARMDDGALSGPRPVTVFLTIDTEDAYFTRPHLMTGDGIGPDFGVFGILDELDKHRLKATFFVNVYESPRQPPGAVEAVTKEISTRGHEVGLHTHPCPNLDFYRSALFHLPRSAQTDVLRWGTDLLERWTNEQTTSFRAGGYALSEETFLALEDVGISVDSSSFFTSQNNRFTPFTVNRVTLRNSIVEVPVTSVLRATPNGRLEHRKLDIDWLSTVELSTALDRIAVQDVRFAMFMMHSFSFIEKATRLPNEPRSPRALFTSETLFSRYVEVYGPKPKMRDAFAAFLENITANPALQVKTLREALPDLRQATTTIDSDIVPVVPLA